MSAAGVLAAAVQAALAADPAVGGKLNGVFAGPVTGARRPFAELGEMLGADWGTKDRRGRELRVLVTIRDAGDTPVRVRMLADAVEARLAALPRMLDGWQVGSVVPVRTRVGGEGPGRWRAAIEFRVRMLEGE